MRKINYYLIASVLLFISAIIQLVQKNVTQAASWGFLGVSFLCLGFINQKKKDAMNQDKDRKDKDK